MLGSNCPPGLSSRGVTTAATRIIRGIHKHQLYKGNIIARSEFESERRTEMFSRMRACGWTAGDDVEADGKCFRCCEAM